MDNQSKKEFNLGGSVERALTGQYELNTGSVLKEAWQKTIHHFLSFSPAIVGLLFIQLAIFYIALKLQLGDPSVILHIFTEPESFTQDIVQAIFMANFSYEVISAPFFAGVSLMAMSHAAGIGTKLQDITKGLQFTVPVILATLFSLILQGISGMVLPFISMYLTLAFSHSILLICEKRITPMRSLLLSLRAVNKKIFTVAGIYAAVMMMFVVAAMFYGIGLIFVLPFFFHVKGILYREMFGIRLATVPNDSSSNDDSDVHEDDSDNSDPKVFNA
ncbi:hypothetical protein BCU68_00285 [Vibrio sp. 10N.286.49.B3]|uniref:hypothetical protein n=1 Tax=Vibrio sp. 10N.286.49.B3 TaxID=1880855 RepID=UPI000C83EEE8|nr:hypothetical protein [Vibrio sp. 10N.286.49.B3]PMH46524.1 hypothetical protein BCU68_00285 [Vibrio sp. 10N.286.49.B3]